MDDEKTPTLEEDLAYLKNFDQFNRVVESIRLRREELLAALKADQSERADAKIIGGIALADELYYTLAKND